MKDQYRNRFLDDVWNIGINGILDKKINELKMREPLSRVTKWVIAGAEATAIVLLGASCDTLPPVVAAENANNNFTPTETTPTATPEVAKINSAEIVVITNENSIQQTVEDLPTNKPQIKDGTEYDVFDIRVGFRNFRTVMYQIAEGEVNKQPVIETTDSMDNKVVSVQNVATFTQFVDVDGKPSWVRLFATNQGSTDTIFNTTWFYDPKGFPTADFQAVDVTRSVLGYSYNAEENELFELTVQPLYVDPMYIPNFDYTNAIDEVIIKGDEPSTMKVQASRDRVDGPPQPEYIDLDIISSVEFSGITNGVQSNLRLSIDKSLDRTHGFDSFIPNESFSPNIDLTFTEFSSYFIYETVIRTNPDSKDLTYIDFNNKLEYAQNHPDEKNVWEGLEIIIFDDATNKDVTIKPTKDMILEIASSGSKTEGLRKTGKVGDDGIRVEYLENEKTLRLVRGFDTVNSPDITAYYLAKQFSALPKLLGRYNGKPIYHPVEQNYLKTLLDTLTNESNYAFKVRLNGEPASPTERQRNP